MLSRDHDCSFLGTPGIHAAVVDEIVGIASQGLTKLPDLRIYNGKAYSISYPASGK
ncbi:MAG TPA: hypothetical protein VIY29_13835 [Ktedonobacteraceae bacterium]